MPPATNASSHAANALWSAARSAAMMSAKQRPIPKNVSQHAGGDASFGDHGTREFFTHVRFHNHDENQIVVHLLVELFARSAEEATEVLEAAARG
jgi:hypothetical protein